MKKTLIAIIVFFGAQTAFADPCDDVPYDCVTTTGQTGQGRMDIIDQMMFLDAWNGDMSGGEGSFGIGVDTDYIDCENSDGSCPLTEAETPYENCTEYECDDFVQDLIEQGILTEEQQQFLLDHLDYMESILSLNALMPGPNNTAVITYTVFFQHGETWTFDNNGWAASLPEIQTFGE